MIGVGLDLADSGLFLTALTGFLSGLLSELPTRSAVESAVWLGSQSLQWPPFIFWVNSVLLQIFCLCLPVADY